VTDPGCDVVAMWWSAMLELGGGGGGQRGAVGARDEDVVV